MGTAAITATEANGKLYYNVVSRGTEYSATADDFGWLVFRRRLALGDFNFGSIKRYSSLPELAASVKAFRGLDLLVGGAA